MRKLTGYIGAMIIVFALMGSVLAGYALNINGESTVINDYEKITDVSGLYTHSEEKSYIEYNPASNYIGYELQQTPIKHNNLNGNHGYKKIDNSIITIRLSDGHIIIDGVDQGFPPWPNDYFICDCFYVDHNGTAPYVWPYWTGGAQATTDIIITVSNGQTTISYNGDTTTKNTTINLANWAGNDWDYWIKPGYASGSTDPYGVFINSINQIATIGFKNGSNLYVSVGNTVRDLFNNTNSYTVSLLSGGSYYAPGVNYQNINYNKTIDGNTYAPYFNFYPRYVYETITPDTGINYTESNRVNNYPIETDYNTYQTTSTASVDLQSFSGANYFNGNNGYLRRSGNVAEYNYDAIFNLPTYSNNDLSTTVNAIHGYKLSDVLSTVTIPAGTSLIEIDAPAHIYTRYVTEIVHSNEFDMDITLNIPYYYVDNWVSIETGNSSDWVTLNDLSHYGRKAYYYPDTGIVEIYQNGVKIATSTAGDTYLFYIDNTANYGRMSFIKGPPYNTTYKSFDTSGRNRPYINLVMTTNGTITNVHYSDITKGYSIKDTNVTSTIWDNNYENGNIQILFRADNIGSVYNNDITINSDNISIDYTGGRFSVTLNGNDPVDIGTWRNIVLNIDLINGSLSAIPVRTFNSFTNVVLENTNINIGNLNDATPTNIISWAPTDKSLMFNIYSTKVFLDTYGVVMINPSLTIMDYFPDLNQFYRLKIYNFATYGDSITINGETYQVTNGTITVDNKVVTLKNLYVEYANGDVTIKDDHIEINTGAIVSDSISMTGTWYFLTDLERGYTTQKMVYDWDWGTFIVDNTQFAVIYVGLLGVSLVVARRFCNLSITDYALMIVSVIIALSVQVIA